MKRASPGSHLPKKYSWPWAPAGHQCDTLLQQGKSYLPEYDFQFCSHLIEAAWAPLSLKWYTSVYHTVPIFVSETTRLKARLDFPHGKWSSSNTRPCRLVFRQNLAPDAGE